MGEDEGAKLNVAALENLAEPGRHPRLGHRPQSGVRDKIALVRRTSASRRSTISRLRGDLPWSYAK
jgi:hypothetical protein